MSHENDDFEMSQNTSTTTKPNYSTQHSSDNTQDTEPQFDSEQNNYEELSYDEEGNPIYTSKWLQKNTTLLGGVAFCLLVIWAIAIYSSYINVEDILEVKATPYLYNELKYFIPFGVIYSICLPALATYITYAFIKRKPNAVFWGRVFSIILFTMNFWGLLYAADGKANVVSVFIPVGFLCFFSVSDQVKSVIPLSFRKTTKWDWIIACLIVILLIASYIIGYFQATSPERFRPVVNELREKKEAQVIESYNQPKFLIDSTLLETNEITNGQIIFKRPKNAYMEKVLSNSKLPKGDYFYDFSNNKKKDGYEMVVFSFVSETMPTEGEIEQFVTNWTSDLLKGWQQRIVKDNQTKVEDGKILEREIKFINSESNTIKSRLVIVFNSKASKVCVIFSMESAGFKAPLETIKESLKFYNKTI